MATKLKQTLNAAHTAGIFADMTVDGPVIGTLVAIVDRAKNLPNRKTIGKQDPYCAARLGKEAKKTRTDIRGGQTPKWDQELRFTVHDSPDYFQLKISVFTDDKKTDLIGESWIDLRSIVIPGGGQNDVWQTLNCKGKYAGEIRIEITYYDTRPKPDKPVAAKPKQPAAEQEHGSIKQRTPVKRRPLPSDPVTGEAPALPALPAAPPAPSSAPPAPPAEQSTPPPRTHAPKSSQGNFSSTQSPLHAVETSTPPSSRRTRHADRHSPSPHGGPTQEYTTPTRAERPRGARQSMNPPAIEPSPRRREEHDYRQSMPPAAIEPAPRHHEERDYRQSMPPAAIEPAPRHHEERDYRQSMPPAIEPAPRHPEEREYRQSMSIPIEQSRHHDEREYGGYSQHQDQQMDHRGHHAPLQDPYDAPPAMDDLRQYSREPERPPPPPAHRSRHNSGGQELVLRSGYDASPPKSSQPMRHDVLRNEAHRHSTPTYPGRPTFREYDTTPSNAVQKYESPPRHSSYDANYDPHYRSMQPTVEDAPESPSILQNNYRQSVSRLQQQDEMCFDNPSPAPLNLSRSPGGSPFREDYSVSQSQPDYQDPNQYQIVPISQARGRDYSRSPVDDYNSHSRDYSRSPGGYDPNAYQIVPASSSRGRDYSRSPGHEPNPYQIVPVSNSHGRDFSRSPGQGSYNSHTGNRMDLETRQIQSSSSHGMPNMPAALVPGLDPALSQEVTDRIYEDRRNDRRHHSQSAQTPTRGRARTDPYQSYPETPDNSQSYAIQPYDRRALTYGGGVEPSMARSRDMSPNPRTSPNPQHTIRRKSVSPIPPPQETRRLRRKSVSPAPPQQEPRRLSGVPFGPDSYDALNPSHASGEGTGASPDVVNPESKKIITYDGREIDPSDHLPIESWAPEPETKAKDASPEPRSRPALTGAQPLPPSTRRTPRSGRHSISAANSYYTPEEPRMRARLQKRNPVSAGNSPAGASPLAPISSDNYQGRQDPYSSPTRGLPRSNTWDSQNENRAPHYGSGPPIPAKVPLPLMSGANGSGNELALMAEMQQIDIGTGRSRRRGGY